MNASTATEYIRAEENTHPFTAWEFSVFDRACFSMVIRGTWIFDQQLDVNAMKAGLGKLLNYYPHLSGRVRDKTGIHLTNDGVPFTVTHDRALSMADAYKKDNPIGHFSTRVRLSKIRSGIDAPLSMKVTSLRDGSVLGIQCFHACMDGDSFYTMVYNWGQVCKKEDFTTPVLDQSLSPVPDDLSKEQVEQAAYEHGWKRISKLSFLKLLPSFISGVLRERTSGFYFSANALNGLKQEISDNNGFPCTTNVALCALVSRMLIKLYNHSEDTECIQVTVANMRNRLAGIPSAFVGNASAPILTPPFSASASIDEIARVIHQSLEPIRETGSQELTELVSLSANVLSHRLPLFPFDVTKTLSKRPTVIHTNNFSKLHIYDVDFGSGGPVSVIPHDLSDPVLIWPAPPAKGGVEVYFSGVPARRIRRLKAGDPWLQEMNQYGQ